MPFFFAVNLRKKITRAEKTQYLAAGFFEQVFGLPADENA
jgi:hypothetical protein